ncbi:VCBS repeat-containing protein [Streptomyces sp. NPDC051597]|uniref:FG-GAP repeat domain-containing protein n=1 Tax=Streptomyces sp. NPDC051597 TaxID=3155049 RepID=UPI0034412B3A
MVAAAVWGAAGCQSAPARPSAPATEAGSVPPPVEPRRPVPHGRGSTVPYDFNGDGHRDLVVDDLAKDESERHGDDAGIAVVYGTDPARALDPAARQILTTRHDAAPVRGERPATFEAEAACDLDGDGFGDLIVTTDPPYDGTGRPPVPLQVLFGGPGGLTTRAVVLGIPGRARYGDDWPDHPVCGDFDGDEATDLAVTATGGRISFLRGPFARTGAPRAAGAPLPGGGPVLAAPEPGADVNGDGCDDLVVRESAAPGARARLLLGGPRGPARPGGTYTYGPATSARPPRPPATALPGGGPAPVTDVLQVADFTGDQVADVAVRVHRDETRDLVAVYAGTDTGVREKPLVRFTTAGWGRARRAAPPAPSGTP